jgi:hypothetical protein
VPGRHDDNDAVETCLGLAGWLFGANRESLSRAGVVVRVMSRLHRVNRRGQSGRIMTGLMDSAKRRWIVMLSRRLTWLAGNVNGWTHDMFSAQPSIESAHGTLGVANVAWPAWPAGSSTTWPGPIG